MAKGVGGSSLRIPIQGALDRAFEGGQEGTERAMSLFEANAGQLLNQLPENPTSAQGQEIRRLATQIQTDAGNFLRARTPAGGPGARTARNVLTRTQAAVNRLEQLGVRVT